MIRQILMEEKRTWGLTHFCVFIVPEKVNGTEKDNSETSSRSAINFCHVNRMGSICLI
jgi:hypothetical protein